MQATPYGLLRPPLGSARLTVVALVAALLRTERPQAEAAIVSAGVLPHCLNLVLRFPFNSILHHQVLLEGAPGGSQPGMAVQAVCNKWHCGNSSIRQAPGSNWSMRESAK